jgi:phosphoesterase RecJ-like protein
VAQALGGGGHAKAAGCTLPGTLEQARRRVLRELKARLGFRLSV